MNINIRKKELKKIVLESDFSNKILIYELLENNLLDKIIAKFENILKDNSNNVKKCYESFLSILNCFLLFIQTIFFTLSLFHIRAMLSTLLKSKYWDIIIYNIKNNDLEQDQIILIYKKIFVKAFINNFNYIKSNVKESITNDITNIIMKEKSENYILEHEEEIDRIIELIRNLFLINVETDAIIYIIKDINSFDNIKELNKLILNAQDENNYVYTLFYKWILFFKDYDEKIIHIKSLYG